MDVRVNTSSFLLLTVGVVYGRWPVVWGLGLSRGQQGKALLFGFLFCLSLLQTCWAVTVLAPMHATPQWLSNLENGTNFLVSSGNGGSNCSTIILLLLFNLWSIVHACSVPVGKISGQVCWGFIGCVS